LQAFKLPDNTGWTGEIQLACFNDDCPYYKRGWDWMKKTYSVAASYRYRVDPVTGEVSPLAVWSPIALRDRIVDAEISVTIEGSEESADAASHSDSSSGETSTDQSTTDAGHVTPGEKK
jgi:hypothetical protein